MSMYLVEGRNLHETRGQYVLSKESAYAILEEMKQDFLKVNIYEKVDGEYSRIEKWEREQTNDEWRKTCSIEEFTEWITNTFCCCDNHPRLKETVKRDWMKWLKQPHTTKTR